jgi:hypothetical protein
VVIVEFVNLTAIFSDNYFEVPEKHHAYSANSTKPT